MATFVKLFGYEEFCCYFAVNHNYMAVKQIKSMRYVEAKPWSTLKVIRRILNFM